MDTSRIDFQQIFSETTPKIPVSYKLFQATGASPRLPAQVTVETTAACQLACPMCDRDEMLRQYQEMPDEIFQAIVGKIAGLPIRLNFNGIGEPLLDKKLIERIKYAKAHGVERTSLITNGLLLTPKKSRELINAGLNRLAISFDSVYQDQLQAVHAGSNAEKVASNIRTLLATRQQMGADDFKVIIRLTVQQGNLDGILDMYRQWFGKVQDIRVNLAYQYGNVQVNPVLPFDWDNRIACPNMFETLLVLTNGATTLCCLGDINAELNTGNLATDSVEHCFSGPIATSIREKHRQLKLDGLDVCQRCTAATGSNFRNAAISREIEATAAGIVQQERLAKPACNTSQIAIIEL